MVLDNLRKVLDYQQKLDVLLNSDDCVHLHELLEQLFQELNNLVKLTCKSKLYLDFNNYFTHSTENEFKSDELVYVDEDNLKLSQKFQESSMKLKFKLNKLKLTKYNYQNKSNVYEDNDNEHMEFLSNESEFFDACQRTTLSMDIGGTFIKVMFMVKLESVEYYKFVKNVYKGYLDSLYLLNEFEQLNKDRLVKYNQNQDLSPMLEFMKSVFLSFKVDQGLYMFKYVPVQNIDKLLSTLKEKKIYTEGKAVNVTGGGAFKHYETLTKNFGLVNKMDEVTCVVEGMNLLSKMRNSVVQYDLYSRMPKVVTMTPVYPYIASSVGSGTFFLKVSSESEFTRVTGTSVSGGTAYGLANYLLPLDSKREFVKLYKSGTNELDSFTKYPFNEFPTFNKSKPYGLYYSLGELKSKKGKTEPEDLNKSLVDMLSYNTGALGYLVAKAFGAKRVVYLGNFLCNYTIESMVSGFVFSSDVYGDKSVEVCFPFHGPYVSTLGCFVMK